MNLVVPPKWRILFEDNTSWSSADGPWSEVGQWVMLDGLMVCETYDRVRQVEIKDEQDILLETLTPPTPRTCFAHKRMAQSLGGEVSEWLSTCFGYVTDEWRYTLRVSPTALVSDRATRSMLFLP